MAIDIIGRYDITKLDQIIDYLLNNGFVKNGYSYGIKNTHYWIQFNDFGSIYYRDLSIEGYDDNTMKNALRNIDGITIFN